MSSSPPFRVAVTLALAAALTTTPPDSEPLPVEPEEFEESLPHAASEAVSTRASAHLAAVMRAKLADTA